MKKFSPDVIEKLRHYVYLYVDPFSKEVFYVGKGSGNRAFSHLDDRAESKKYERICSIRRDRDEPRIELLAHGLDEKAALQIETAVIDLLEKQKLANKVRGWRSGTLGRMTVKQIQALYSASEVEIKHPCVLIRINEHFRYGLKPVELYDVTRGVWKVGPNRDKARFALAVFEGVIQEVYQITAWFPGGSTLMATRDDTVDSERWEFVGRIAPSAVRDRYRFKSVRKYFAHGNQNPIRYLNVK